MKYFYLIWDEAMVAVFLLIITASVNTSIASTGFVEEAGRNSARNLIVLPQGQGQIHTARGDVTINCL